jgi:hypothetical protein
MGGGAKGPGQQAGKTGVILPDFGSSNLALIISASAPEQPGGDHEQRPYVLRRKRSYRLKAEFTLSQPTPRRLA